MAKFKVLSWLSNSQNGSSSNGDINKKSNRRSLSTSTYLKSKDETLQSKKQQLIPEKEPQTTESRMVFLAETIRTETEKLETYLKLNGLPLPSFDANAPSEFPALPKDIQKSREEIIFATRELSSLAAGPREEVRYGAWRYLDTLSLQLVNGYGIAKLVPLDSPISLTELQTKTTLDPVNLARTIRHAMTNHVFYEPSPGLIAHTAASRALAEDSALQAWVGFNTEDAFPAAGRVIEALRQHPEGTSLTRAGFNVAFQTVDQEPMFVTLGKDPARAKRFAGAMASLATGEGYEHTKFVDTCDLSEINAKSGTFVDVGGSHGFVSVDLAKRWKNINFIVQDLPRTIESAPRPICEDVQVAERVELQVHDFFKPQTLKDVDVFYFRFIIHNYSTPYAISILKNLIPALKPGSRILINDYCIREPGLETPADEKLIRSMDLVMLLLLNAQERQEWEFKELFKNADPRYEFKGVQRIPHHRLCIIEAVWNPEQAEVSDVNDKAA